MENEDGMRSTSGFQDTVTVGRTGFSSPSLPDTAPVAPCPLQQEEQQQRTRQWHPPSLPLPLRFLFALHGLTMQIPNLALMSILNDRASVPPTYLPAYGAICFLPWSLKPVYAFLSSSILRLSCGAHNERGSRHILIAVLLAINGLSFVGTAFVPTGGVTLCFVWGFIRGVAGSWPEFLLGVTLVECARRSSSRFPRASYDGQSGGAIGIQERVVGEDKEEKGAPKFEELGSVFQSQAATSRNVGSLTGAAFTFILFAWRHFLHVETELSTAVVTALLVLTAGLSIVGSVIALRYKVGTFDSDGLSVRDTRRRQRVGRYDGVSTAENDLYEDDTPLRLHREISPDSQASNVTSAVSESSSNQKLQQRVDVAALVLFQTLLVVTALKGPIVSAASNATWVSLMTLVSLGLALSLVAGSYYQYQKEGGMDLHTAQGLTENDPIPPRRLALYLILRHSVPSPGYVLYSFLYSLFSAIPLLMELLSIMGSIGSTIASWCYQRFIAKKYTSGWGIIGLIAVLTIMGAVLSLLDIITVHLVSQSIKPEEGNGNAISFHLCSLVFSLYILTGFIAEFKFLPSLVLATTNIVSDDEETLDVSLSSSCDNDCDERFADESKTFEKHTAHPQYDESMQYASFVSCIDFGGQISSWATVPIISSLGISRENGWENLDQLIMICALAHMASVAFLWIIRPTAS
mmetsp:Transcript_36056/g.107825  ORF Transcript_36056/g.107825 Transcript_36056/m.107825 type:complete len:691 (-) Transcript_36056:74-2146(-)